MNLKKWKPERFEEENEKGGLVWVARTSDNMRYLMNEFEKRIHEENIECS